MNWTSVEDALHSILVTATGLAGDRVCFAHARGPAPSTSPFVRIEVVEARRVGSIDVVTTNPVPAPGSEILSTSWTHFRMQVRAHVFSSVTSGASSAGALASVIAGELNHPDTMTALDVLDVSITDADFTRLPALFETAFQDRAVVTLTLWAWIDRTHVQTFVETVFGTATYLSPGHAPVVIPFGPVPTP